MSTCSSDLMCECFVDGELVRMDVHDLSHNGFFAETTALFELGQELAVRLVGGAASQPVSTRVVVESQLASGAGGPEGEPGVWLRLLRFSPDYGLLLPDDSSTEHASQAPEQRGRSTQGREQEEEEKSLANRLGPEDATPPTQHLQEQELEPEQEQEQELVLDQELEQEQDQELELELDQELEPEPEPEQELVLDQKLEPEQDQELVQDQEQGPVLEYELLEVEELEPLSERAGRPLWSEDPVAPEATVIDDGELDDVVRILAELGVKADRPSPDGDSFDANWIRPERLLVVTARRALVLGLPLRSRQKGFVSVVVFDGDARSVCSRVRRLGYQYVISRPIHPQAMSMLFRQAIFPNREKRATPREIPGCSVRWSCGWARKQPGVMLDVSLAGCQLMVPAAVAQGSRIKIHVPREVADGRDFMLVGRVIRSSSHDDETMLGITFDKLSAKVQQSMQRLLALPGPCRLTGDPLLSKGDGTASKWVKAAQDVPQADRRRKHRAEISREVVALENDSRQVKHVLVSTDLTLDGMHVEAHPSLDMGDRMDLALYSESECATLMLSAVVARDDGRSGWWLRFVGVTPEVRERLTRALHQSPSVLRLDGPDSEMERVALGEVLDPKPPGEDELA